MRRLRSRQFAISLSVWLHLGVIVAAACYRAPSIWNVKFAGQRQSVSVTAIYAPAVQPAEPEPVDFVMEEANAETFEVHLPPNSDQLKRTIPIEPTLTDSELKTPLARQVPPAPLAKRANVRRQIEIEQPKLTPIPRSEPRPMDISSVATVPVSLGTDQETPPSLAGNAAPIYPREAKQRGWQGVVVLRITIDANGQVSAVRIHRTSGYEILDQAAAAAVRGWKGVPAKRGGIPVRSAHLIQIRFVR